MKKIFYLLGVSIVLLTSCEKSEKDQPVQSREFVINSTSSTVWKYFSFSKNDTVVIADPMTSTEWDLAFQRYRVKTNGGLSGSGQGAAANSYSKMQTGFDGLKTVSDTVTFSTDKSVQIAVQQGYATYIINPELYTWFKMETGGSGTQIIPTDYVYFVKTADGKFAKVWFKSYYSTSNASGHVTIQYKYQPDGSKNLE